MVALNQDWKIFVKLTVFTKRILQGIQCLCHSGNQSKLLQWLPLFIICHFRKYINDFAIKRITLMIVK